MQIARLDMDIRAPSEHPDRTVALDCYALGRADLSCYAGLLVGPTVDQEYLLQQRAVIREFLDHAGVVVFGGHLHRNWLPGAAPFVPLPTPSLHAYRVVSVAEHPIFAGVDPDDLTFRRGVAGFFARGHHPPPGGAEVLVRLAGGQPATYVDRTSTPGTILVQATCDLLGYASFPNSSAARIPGQLLDWVVAEAGARHAADPAVAR